MGSRGGVLIYVRINDQSLSGIWSKQSPFRVQLAGQAVVGHIVEQSLLHRYILRFLPMGDEREFDKWKVSKEFLLLNMIWHFAEASGPCAERIATIFQRATQG